MSDAIGVNDVSEDGGLYRCSLCGAEKRVRPNGRAGPCGTCRGSGVRWEPVEAPGGGGTFRPRGSAVREPRAVADERPTWRPRGSGRSRVRDETGDGSAGKRGPVFVEEQEADDPC